MKTLRSAKSLIALSVLGMSIGVPLIFFWAVAWPCPSGLSEDPSYLARETKSLSREQTTAVTVAQFKPYWDQPLRRPLYDPPPKPAAKQVPIKKQIPSLQLVGTIVEPGRSVAIVKMGSDKLQLKRVGESLGPKGDDCLVESVDSDSIVVRRGSELLSVSMKTKTQQQTTNIQRPRY